MPLVIGHEFVGEIVEVGRRDPARARVGLAYLPPHGAGARAALGEVAPAGQGLGVDVDLQVLGAPLFSVTA